jgi:hypothetical protein
MAAPSLRTTVGWVLLVIGGSPVLRSKLLPDADHLNFPPGQAGDLAQAAVFRKRALVGAISDRG